MKMAVTYLSEMKKVAGILVQQRAHYYLQVGEQFSLLANCSSAISIDKLISYTEVKKVHWP
jgi:hypothetical protein